MLDAYDVLERKIDLIINGKPIKPKDDTKAGKTSARGKKDKQTKKGSKSSSKKSSKGDKKQKQAKNKDKGSKNSSKKSSKGEKKEKKPKEKQAKNKSKGSKSSSKKSSKGEKKDKKGKKGKKKREMKETFLDISLDTFVDIINAKLEEFVTGIIIESLNSNFIRQPLLAMNLLLKSAKNMRYIHFVLLSYTFEDYRTYEENLKKLQQQRELQKQADMLQKITDMDSSEYSDIPEEYLEVYRKMVLLERKKNSLRKREALHKRMEAKKAGLKKDSKKKTARSTAGSKGICLWLFFIFNMCFR